MTTTPTYQYTKNTQAFMKANDESPVIIGAAKRGGGGLYTLQNKQTFSLTLTEARSLPEEYPKWKSRA
ncbi:hypothetical protein GOZ96_05000 [Agrobacterium vitis]|uniref:Uncharacterized protein n=1 Tax=Agrobacterium vitis TaxID=373 RepID=A0A7J4WX25_AGRVI|nr:hypothetical protein [Agrobacterium vitis]KAA3518870.1 hypothetical protein DXT89_26740 [Agrobacterium vitis]MUZ95947.1 hypothetical protein [Agrobacterium vitis]